MSKRGFHVDDPARFGRRLRAVRDGQALSQRALAAGLCSPAYVSRVEVGERVPSLQLVHAFAARLSVSPNWLARGKGVEGDELTQAGRIAALERENEQLRERLRKIGQIADA